MKHIKWMVVLVFSCLLLIACQEDNVETEDIEKENESDTIKDNKTPFDYDMNEVSFRMDKDKEYIFKIFDEDTEQTITQTYAETTENEKGIWDHWISVDDAEENEFLIMEDEEGLYRGRPLSEYYQEMAYPIEEGATFEDWEDTYTTTEIDQTMTVEAGEFDHVVEVESPEGYVSYFAPDVGRIQMLDDKGNVVSELIELK